jgi:hypothetical protein
MDWCKSEKKFERVGRKDDTEEYSPNKYVSPAIVNDPLRFEEMTKFMLLMIPQGSIDDMIDQLTLHQNLHILYESGVLSKNMCSAYLYMTLNFRMDILHHLGSPLATSWDRQGRPLPDVWERLAKFPPRSRGLADKGFYRNGRFFPFFWIEIATPPVMKGRKVKSTVFLRNISKPCR